MTRVIRYNSAKQADGAFTEYYPGLRLKTMGRYKYGARHGKWRYFDEKGKAVRRERYRAGVLTSSKDFRHPRRRYITLFGPKNYSPPPYEIIEPGDPAKVQFASDSIPKTHGPWGISSSLQFTQRDFGALSSRPWMFGLPRDYFLLWNTELHLGVREKFFVTGALGFSISGKHGSYLSLPDVSVMTMAIRAGLTGNLPVLKRQRSMLFLSAGGTWNTTYIESGYPAGNTGMAYFENSVVLQPAAVAGLVYELTRKPNVPNAMTCLSLRAGYSYPLAASRRKEGPYYSSGNYSVSVQGFYIGIAVTSWKVRK